MLRQAVRANPSRQPRGRFVTMPAPVAGLNFRDSIAQLKPNEALILDNFFPEASYVRLRRGFAEHATGFPAAVETLMEYASPTSRKLWAAAGTAIYDATSAGAIGAAALSSLTNARWQHTMFTTSGGDYLVAVNAADGVRTYDGSTWATQSITGATAADFIDVTVWGNRLWFVEDDSAKAWYLPSGAIAGAATALDLGPVYSLGGRLAIITPLSFNSGSDVEQGIAFVSTEGEVALYSGTDPSGASTFALVGRFRISPPVAGARSYTRFNGDCLVLTESGLVSLLVAMRLDASQQTNASVSDKIDQQLARQVGLQRAAFGWQVFLYPRGSALYVNAPQGSSVFDQWVMNSITVAWCRYQGMNARCWGLLDGAPYFGGATVVYRADFGADDDGAATIGEVKTAFSTLGTNGLKRLTMLRPFLAASAAFTPVLGVDVDFSDNIPSDTAPTPDISVGLWDTSLWDNAPWGGESYISREWSTIGGIGTWMAPRMRTSTIGVEVVLNAFDAVFEPMSANAL
jgi:hypothetical protein